MQLIYNEKDIENILAENCQHFLGIKFIARQFKTKVGIIDIIAKNIENPNYYYIIELKKDTIDAAAYTQVMRYSTWCNSELSKHGKRIFHPILIGDHLAPTLDYLCQSFDCESHCCLPSFCKPSYRLFHFDPLKGAHFSWVSTTQVKAQEDFVYKFCHIEKVESDLEYFHYDQYCKAQLVVNNG